MKIGIIDSGRGGLALGKKLNDISNSIIYILDKSFFPYGDKSMEFLIKRSIILCNLLIKYNVDIIILACNTLSIYAYKFLKNYFNIKIYDVFSYFINFLNSNNTIIGSKNTIKYIKENYNINVIDGTDFIYAIENKLNLETYINEINKIKTNVLILGCTHFLNINNFKIKTLDQIAMLKEDIKK